ncbi:hypothetical protein FVE85_7165 [Porphyridium purpureum]|uniref:VOC domain-containing protein n=1 Tax=Porphyridium purpureum TaxID=35688 RepID=A0A5J4Z8Z9_PORPP|nr:hypothetical protein FVE85_7165 [Porphyridium purpureum]|eukprot:POR1838..scf295_1
MTSRIGTIRILLLVRDVSVTTRFFTLGLGMKTDRFARLQSPNLTTIEVCSGDGEASCTTGYSPFLVFEVEDMDSKIPALLSMGATLDGPILYKAYGKTAAMRSPCGHMIGLREIAGNADGVDERIAAGAAARTRLNEMKDSDRDHGGAREI